MSSKIVRIHRTTLNHAVQNITAGHFFASVDRSIPGAYDCCLAMFSLHELLKSNINSDKHINLFTLGMWASREMLKDDSDKQLYVKTTLRELFVYCIFMFVICCGNYY